MRRLGGIALCLACGCTFDTGGPADLDGGGITADAASGDGGAADAAAVDADTCGWSPAPAHVDPCALPAAPSGPTVISAGNFWTYDTTGGQWIPAGGPAISEQAVVTQPDGSDLAVVAVQSLEIESTGALRVIGDKPLLLASLSTIEVRGTLDVSSDRLGDRGAGANPAVCDDGGRGGAGAGTGARGGGGGGGFRGFGGRGGKGDGGALDGGSVGGAVPVPDSVRGGCPGGPGGGDGAPLAAGSAGGGAIQLTARQAIQVSGGFVDASGAGGGGVSDNDDGGGGAGSGGSIGFEAPDVNVNQSFVIANGGSGGAGDQPAEAGQNGGSAEAQGGSNGQGGDGGDGSFGPTLNGQPGLPDDKGGGGGGGGAGYILTGGPLDAEASTISPAPVQTQ